jgi:intracellular sulfur oxidation DsrE/DsrF family protein
VDYGAGWRGRAYAELLTALDNHVQAVGADKLRVAVVLQGSGADLLASAKSEPRLAKRIDALRQKGVHFLICRNTLLGRLIDPFRDLYGVTEHDIVTAAVAEIVALQQEGYVYLHL